MTVAEIRARLAAWIGRERPRVVVLFGSAVGGVPGPEPDLDLAVLFGRPFDALRAVDELILALGRDDIDLMVLDHADPIARLAACRGVVVHEATPGQFARFASIAQRQFMDTTKLQRARRELTDEFLRRRGVA
jgi:hypothetical protein